MKGNRLSSVVDGRMSSADKHSDRGKRSNSKRHSMMVQDVLPQGFLNSLSKIKSRENLTTIRESKSNKSLASVATNDSNKLDPALRDYQLTMNALDKADECEMKDSATSTTLSTTTEQEEDDHSMDIRYLPNYICVGATFHDEATDRRKSVLYNDFESEDEEDLKVHRTSLHFKKKPLDGHTKKNPTDGEKPKMSSSPQRDSN